MKKERSMRIVVGTVCLIAVALAMGWFVGRYIPGEPKEPAADASEVLARSSERAASQVVDFEAGTTMKLPSLLQGEAHELADRAQNDLGGQDVEHLKAMDVWERNVPSIDVDVAEIRTVSSQSFADFNPAYYGASKVLSDGEMILVTARLTNTSQERYEAWWSTLPTFTLYNDALADGDGAMGAGVKLDVVATYLLNPSEYRESPDTPLLVDVAPGETQTIVLPFRITRNALADPTAMDDLDPSDFCMQTADYTTGTIYRLWL